MEAVLEEVMVVPPIKEVAVTIMAVDNRTGTHHNNRLAMGTLPKSQEVMVVRQQVRRHIKDTVVPIQGKIMVLLEELTEQHQHPTEEAHPLTAHLRSTVAEAINSPLLIHQVTIKAEVILLNRLRTPRSNIPTEEAAARTVSLDQVILRPRRHLLLQDGKRPRLQMGRHIITTRRLAPRNGRNHLVLRKAKCCCVCMRACVLRRCSRDESVFGFVLFLSSHYLFFILDS
mmetsp:Transcript_4355/g.8976  ORF Transcript_4355/g.8976 Transcript_4355/m.8976 type:complete len:229 (+) Transcript_4355:284-970(+)